MGHRPAQSQHHVFQDVILPNAQRGPQKLGGQVPVAQMPGYADQRRHVICRDLQQWLVQRFHADDGAILQQQPVAAAQVNRSGQIEQDGFTFLGLQGQPPAMAMVMIQPQPSGNLLIAVFVSCQNLSGASHGSVLKKKISLGQREFLCRFTSHEFAIGTDFIGFGVNLYDW